MIFSRFFRKRPLVLVICTANVCRSPVAAAMLRARLKGLGGRGQYLIKSAGTRVASPGRIPDPRMKDLAKRVGLSLSGERATPLTRDLARRAVLIVAMEEKQLKEVEELLADDDSRPELRRLGDWYPGDTGADGDIADPYFANRLALETAFDQIDAAIGELARDLLSTGRPAPNG